MSNDPQDFSIHSPAHRELMRKRRHPIRRTKTSSEIRTLDDAIRELLEAADSAADWLIDTHEGSDQWERGQALLSAIRNVRDF